MRYEALNELNQYEGLSEIEEIESVTSRSHDDQQDPKSSHRRVSSNEELQLSDNDQAYFNSLEESKQLYRRKLKSGSIERRKLSDTIQPESNPSNKRETHKNEL